MTSGEEETSRDSSPDSERIVLDETVIQETWHGLRPLPKAVFYYATWKNMSPEEIVDLFTEDGLTISIDRVGKAYWEAWLTVLRALRVAQARRATSPGELTGRAMGEAAAAQPPQQHPGGATGFCFQ
jgi:hypothetical protein